jgi:REP element-mobilizing transposase RayT
VYNRFANGEPVFADPEEAKEFVELLRFVKRRDGWTVFAWVLMSNHYHLAVRSSAVPISRGFHDLQGRFSQRFNRRRRRTGALWQSRYHARPVDQQGYLDRVILYIHLNPVAGGLVEHPADHVFGGHREIAKRVSNPLVDVDSCLLSFGQREKEARKAYLSAIRQGCRELGREPGTGPGLKEMLFSGDRDRGSDDPGPYLEPLGRKAGPERPSLPAEEFVVQCASCLGVEVGALASGSRQQAVVESRRLIVTLGRERWNQRTKDLASALGKSADTVTFIQREGTRRRLEDDTFRRRFEYLDRHMSGTEM